MDEIVLFVSSIVGLVVWAGAVFVLAGAAFVSVVLHPRLRRTAIPDVLPSMALIRPIAGSEYRMKEVTESSLGQDHPDIVTIFAVSSDRDPALPLIRDLHREFPERSRVVFGERHEHANPKLDNMKVGVEDAQARYLFFSDANTLLERSAARRWQAQALAFDCVISALPEGVDPQSLAAWTECAFFNHQFRLNATLDWLGMQSVHGKAMILSADHFRALGGIDALGRYPAEDFAMARAAAAKRIPAHVSEITARTPLGPRTWHAIWSRQKRWAQLRAGSVPASIWAEFATLMVPSGIAGSLAFASLWDVAPLLFLGCHALLWLLVDVLSAGMRGQAFGVRIAFACFARELMNPVVFLTGFFLRRIEWRGQIFMARPGR